MLVMFTMQNTVADMLLFDSHCHINDPKFDDDRDAVISRMHQNGIAKAVVVYEASECNPDFGLIGKNDFLYMAAGVHPHFADKWSNEVKNALVKMLSRFKNVALGEIGLDYHYDLSSRENQKRAFDEQLDLAYALNKPVILHIREAHGDAYDILSSKYKSGCLPKGVMHCYSGSFESARDYIDMGMYISFSGSLTFNNAVKLREAAARLPLDKLMVETDCPYMTPVPLRGQRNEPAYVRFTLEKLAEIKGVPPEEAAASTFLNACTLFNIKHDFI